MDILTYKQWLLLSLGAFILLDLNIGVNGFLQAIHIWYPQSETNQWRSRSSLVYVFNNGRRPGVSAGVLSPGKDEETQKQFEMQDRERLEMGQEDGGSGKKNHEWNSPKMEQVELWGRELPIHPVVQARNLGVCLYTFLALIPQDSSNTSTFFPSLTNTALVQGTNLSCLNY